MANDKGTKSGWSDRELLICLLNVVTKSSATLNYDDVGYPPGRTANGFKQKIHALKTSLKPEWDAYATGAPVPEGTPKKTATPRKRKAKTNEEANGDDYASPKKPRGRPEKKSAEALEVEEDLDIKEEKYEFLDIEAEKDPEIKQEKDLDIKQEKDELLDIEADF